MARCFIESREAFSRGDRAAAKVLSNQGKNHKQKMEQLHKEASDWIYHGQCYPLLLDANAHFLDREQPCKLVTRHVRLGY